MLKIVIKDLEDTKRLAKIVSEGIEDRLVLLLNGDLAAGKTTFTKYFADLGYRYDALVSENKDSGKLTNF